MIAAPMKEIPAVAAKLDRPQGTPLRICHLGKFYHPASGGIETHLRTLAQVQARLGADVRVLCVNHLDRQGRDVTWSPLARTPTVFEQDGAVRITRVGRQGSVARFDFCFRLPQLLASLRRSADIVHLHVPNPTMLLALAAVGTCLPLVITYHSDVVRQKRLVRLIRPVENRLFRKAKIILATSPAYISGSELLQAHTDKVAVLPFGIDLGRFLQPSEEALRFAGKTRREHGEPLWLAVGRLVYYKGLANAIKALASVPGRLLVVGEGPLGPELRQLANRTGTADRVIWCGRLNEQELSGAYHAATALWFPSNARSEAFGFVQIEAMASGCPVINTAIPGSGVPWVSRHEESGLTVPVDDALALARAANRLLDKPALREFFSYQARERACREFGADLMGRRSLEVYRGVLNAPPLHQQRRLAV
jgi:rhamnosyl/mannosyltransferase